MAHFNITFKPDGTQISIHAGATILEAASRAGIILNTVCGGRGVCGKCKVKLADDTEILACQHKINADLTVTIPQTSRFYEQKILTAGIETKQKAELDIYKKYSNLTAGPVLGLAIDIGTTTVVAKLIDLKTGSQLATEADSNPQSIHGDDVISRINYAKSRQKPAELNKLITDCINNLINKLCEKTAARTEQIYEAAVVGNTTMNHLFLHLPVESLGKAPYKAYKLDAQDLPAAKFSLKINPEANIHTVANIAGFVGADTTAAALAADIENQDEITMLIDIGTNGEIVLGNKNKLLAASCAAGPAFEGARIEKGSRAAAGAIEAVVFAGDDIDIDIDVIDGGTSHSICGSGLLDAAAVMLDLGIIDSTGRFTKAENLPAAIEKRITEIKGQPAFILADTDQTQVYITQSDIRQLQLAKAAIRAGAKILQKNLGIDDSAIEQIFLAGAFGNFLRKESALRIGLLPQIGVERIKFIGNAAANGAELILLRNQLREKAKSLAKKIEYIELANDKDFQAIFTNSMNF